MCGGLNESELANYGQRAIVVEGGRVWSEVPSWFGDGGPRPGLNWPTRRASWEPAVTLAGGNGRAPLYPVIKQDVAIGAGLGGAVGRRAKAQEWSVKAEAQVGVVCLDNACGDEDEWLGTD